MKIKFLPMEERPMEKCLSYGASSLSNRELIALLVNSGTSEKSAMDLAEDIIAKDESGISYLRTATIEELMAINGIGKAKATRILAAVELGKRLAMKPVKPGMSVADDEDVKFPPFLKVVKDITGNKDYYNYNLAIKKR